ncbi:MAG: hypothetical protein OHK0029_41010 [Armatimonadaceae bacterium]
MDRRNFLLGAVATALLPTKPSGAQPANQPNILFIFSDDHATQAISAYGGRLKDIAPTPNIDRIAREGALFQNSFCANSICGPSRACILTGKHTHINGFEDNNNSKFDGSQMTFPKLLQKAGYQTAIIGKWHLVSDPTGFDHWEILPGQGSYYNPDFLQMDGTRKRFPGYCTSLVTEKALDWLKSGRDTNKPFMLMCQHKAPHRNWMPPPEHLDLFDDVTLPEPPTLFDDYANRSKTLAEQEMTIARHMTWISDLKLDENPETNPDSQGVNGELKRMNPEQLARWNAAYRDENKRFVEEFRAGKMSEKDITRWKYQRYMKDYLRCVRGVDDSVGQLLEYLDNSGLADNTVVIYCSDQGFYLGEHGWYDKRWMFEESLKMPFVIRWKGAVQPGSRPDALIQNIDYAPTFLDMAGVKPPAEIQGVSLTPVLQGKKPADWRSAIYYRYTGERTHAVAAHDGVRTDRYKLIYFWQTGEWNLFDLEKDPQELRSVHADPQYHKTRTEMENLYQKLRAQYKVKS